MPSHRQLLADMFEEEHGPLPNPADTHGAHLVTAPPTPCGPSRFSASFCDDLVYALSLLESRMVVRRELYGPDADASRLAHTPPELRASHQTNADRELREWMEAMTPPTPPTSPMPRTPAMSPSEPSPASTPASTPEQIESSTCSGSSSSRKRKRDSDEEDAGEFKRRRIFDNHTAEDRKSERTLGEEKHACKTLLHDAPGATESLKRKRKSDDDNGDDSITRTKRKRGLKAEHPCDAQIDGSVAAGQSIQNGSPAQGSSARGVFY